MGFGMSSYDDDYYLNRRFIYPNRRIIYVTQPGTVLVSQANIPPGMALPFNPNPRIIINNSIPVPYGQRRVNAGLIPMPFPPNAAVQMKKPKKTIPNLGQIFEEIELTQSILDKGEQKKCSICLEDFEIGCKIIYLPCFHYYHAKCIETWVKNSDKCPLCNIEIKIPQ